MMMQNVSIRRAAEMAENEVTRELEDLQQQELIRGSSNSSEYK